VEQRHPPGEQDRVDINDPIARVLRFAGSRPQPDPERKADFKRALRAEWLRVAEPRPQRRTFGWAGGIAAGIAAALVLAWLQPWPGEQGAQRVVSTPEPAGSVIFVTGAVTIRPAGAAGERSLRAGDSVGAGSTVVTGAGGRGAIVLPDGVEVRFDRETSATVETGRRLALARGALYIDTSPTPDSRLPAPDSRLATRSPAVDIVALGALVRDVGTRYEVRVTGDELRVRVRDGRVHVRRGREMREAAPGAQLTLNAAGMLLSPADGFGPDWDWIVRAVQTPPIQGRRLAEFLAWVEREGGRRIRFGDQAIERAAATTIVYGTIEGLSVEEALAVVLPSCGLAHRTGGGTIIIVVAEDPRGRR
jgi:ferric-dicitrate binding protein FerR (iron transport regulator)